MKGAVRCVCPENGEKCRQTCNVNSAVLPTLWKQSISLEVQQILQDVQSLRNRRVPEIF